MRWSCLFVWRPPLGVLAALLLIPAVSMGSDRIKGVRQFNPDDETVEIFSATDEGKLEVKLIPRDSTQCRVLIHNKTDKPLNVALPDALAGVPLLAQVLPLDGNLDRADSVPQRLGIGNPFGNDFLGNRGNPLFNMPGRPNLIGPQAGPMFAPFNVAPEKVAQLRLPCVCLDHGKPNPRPKMRYRLMPIASVTDQEEVQAICGMLGRGQISQQVAQAAAWHLHNDMSWQELAVLERSIMLGRIVKPMFTGEQLAEAKKAVDRVTDAAGRPDEPGKSDSLSLR